MCFTSQFLINNPQKYLHNPMVVRLLFKTIFQDIRVFFFVKNLMAQDFLTFSGI